MANQPRHIMVILMRLLQFAIIPFLLLLKGVIPGFVLIGVYGDIFSKVIELLLIIAIGWMFVKLVNSAEEAILRYLEGHATPDLVGRKIKTQTLLLKKVMIAVIVVVTLAAGLMVFESVRVVGAGLLTTAGVVGAVSAFASQQSLSRLFTGLQLAFTQPIRIGDAVIIEQEMGYVEEITLSYVVIKLWDLRRLILPADYFFSKGVQNLSRYSTELLGTIYFYADYTLPVDQVREKFFYFLKHSVYWNGNVGVFQVTEMKSDSMELRALVSAMDAATLWDLRCDIREKLMGFIVKEYPHCLPMKRNADPVSLSRPPS